MLKRERINERNIPATGAPSSAPKKVPAERMETTRDSVDEEMAYGLVESPVGWPKVMSQSGISLTPLITPVS